MYDRTPSLCAYADAYAFAYEGSSAGEKGAMSLRNELRSARGIQRRSRSHEKLATSRRCFVLIILYYLGYGITVLNLYIASVRHERFSGCVVPIRVFCFGFFPRYFRQVSASRSNSLLNNTRDVARHNGRGKPRSSRCSRSIRTGILDPAGHVRAAIFVIVAGGILGELSAGSKITESR